METDRELLALSATDLAKVDPVVSNILVAKAIPQLSKLYLPRYQSVVDCWANDFRPWMKQLEHHFHDNPRVWHDDLNFFNLGLLCQYIECELGIEYREDQRNLTRIRYTDPSDLFLNGVIDTRRGTCANLPVLHIAMAWRLGWPVSLACAGSHLFVRYDDGRVKYNVESTQSGHGGMKSDPDEHFVKEYHLTNEAITSGSDLRAVTPRELLGIFVSLRARHYRDVRNWAQAEEDYMLARHLFPTNRDIYALAMGVSVLSGMRLFHVSEAGGPYDLAKWIFSQHGFNNPVYSS